MIQIMYKKYQQHTFLIITDHPDPVYEKIKEITEKIKALDIDDELKKKLTETYEKGDK